MKHIIDFKLFENRFYGMSEEEAKKAYKKFAKDNHPDKGGDTEEMKNINHEYDDYKNSKATKNNDSDSDIDLDYDDEYNFDDREEHEYWNKKHAEDNYDQSRKRKSEDDYRKGKQEKETADYNVYEYIDEYFSETPERKKLALDYYEEISNTYDGPVNEFVIISRAIEHAMYLIQNKKCTIKDSEIFANILELSIKEIKNNNGSFKSSEWG